MNNFLKIMAAVLLMLMAAYFGAFIQEVVAERDYYHEKAERADFKEYLNRFPRKF